MKEYIKNHNIILFLSIFTSLICLLFFFKIVSAPIIIEKLSIKTNHEKEDLKISLVPENQNITIVFGGDVMLSRTVNSKIEQYNDYSWPFLKIIDYFKKADLSIINLESPFLKNSNYQVLSGSFSFKANPFSINGLIESGVDIVSLANNHTVNQGLQGIIDTMDILKENNISYTGAGINEEEARKPVIKNINSEIFAFLSYAYPNDYSIASKDNYGIVSMDEKKMTEDIKKLINRENKPDYIIILMHAGTEYVSQANWQQKEFAHLAIDSGASMVVGHHPHWPQEYEIYKNSPIIYSLGNLIFDQMWSNETRQGLILESTWQNGLKSLKLIPSKIYDYGQVKILDENILIEKNEIDTILNNINAPLNGIIYER